MKPKTLGVTGGIGAGKSIVCRIFSALGVPVYDADSRARVLMESNPELMRSIRAHFGQEAYTEDKQLNRAWLADRVFGLEAEVAKLNALVHPHVGLDFSRWLAEQAQHTYVIKEAALLFETGSYKQLDAVLVVQAPESLRLQRTLMRDAHRTRAQVEDIMRRQWSEDEKIRLAQYTVQNDERHLLTPQVVRLHQRLLQKVASL